MDLALVDFLIIIFGNSLFLNELPIVPSSYTNLQLNKC